MADLLQSKLDGVEGVVWACETHHESRFDNSNCLFCQACHVFDSQKVDPIIITYSIYYVFHQRNEQQMCFFENKHNKLNKLQLSDRSNFLYEWNTRRARQNNGLNHQNGPMVSPMGPSSALQSRFWTGRNHWKNDSNLSK